MPQLRFHYIRFITTSLLLLVSFMLYGQEQDSSQLDFARLTWKDLRTDQKQEVGTRVISGSRTEKDIADLPFTIFVVTGEEIRQKGYLTLTDVLKRLPGIRVSQPGSALDGETFLMRGLQGNTYAKILINDIPVKPFVAKGMPIGAQLPIRDAERIEVIYGPAATLYGADASAGVINIILKDTDRPVYVQSDLGFGGNGFKNLDIMFAGKMGKDKRVLNFRIYGNYTTLDDRRVKYDAEELYDPKKYEDILQADGFSYLDRPNYEEGFLLNGLPHQSNALGVDIKYRKFQFSLQQLSRIDHSAIGLSPYAVSYANPLNYFGERINTVNLNYENSFKRFRLKTSLGVLSYQTDERSSFSFIVPLYNFMQQTFVENYVSTPDQIDSMRQVIDETYFSGSRYSKASSIESNLEILLGFNPNKNIEISTGVNFQAGSGDPLTNYGKSPLSSFETGTANFSGEAFYTDFSGFVESYFNYGKWNAILGAQAFLRRNNYLVRDRVYLNPRIAFQYRATPKFSMRFSAGRSFRYPSPYYASNSFTIDTEQFNNITGTELAPEQTYSAELGGRWRINSNISADFSAYYTRTTNFILYLLSVPGDPDGSYFSSIKIGYENDTNAYARLLGIQTSIKLKNIIPILGLSTTFNINYSKGKESSGAFSFDEGINTTLNLAGLRSQPDWIGQLDVELHPFKRWRFLFENTWMTKSYTRNVLLYQVPELLEGIDIQNNGFFTIDALASYQFNKNILGYIKMNNVLSTKYAGIDATDDGDGLLYNPQSKRYTRIGINYRLE